MTSFQRIMMWTGIVTSVVLLPTLLIVGVVSYVKQHRTPSYLSTTYSGNKTIAISLPNKYDDEKAKFSINFPENWEYEQPNTTSVVIGGKEGTPAFDSTVNIQTVLTKDSGGTYSSLTGLMGSLKKQVKRGLSNVQFLGEGSINLPATTNHDKMAGRYLVFTYTYNGMAYRQLQFIFLRNDNRAFYTWGYTAPTSRYDVDYPIAKAIFASWKVY